MFVPLVVSSLILGSVVAVPPLSSPLSSDNNTLEEQLPLSNFSHFVEEKPAEGEDTGPLATMTNFKYTFMNYEKRVETFLDNIKSKEQSLKNAESEAFLDEMKTYIDSLPTSGAREVRKKYRKTCQCDGALSIPCPEKCYYSCYGYKPADGGTTRTYHRSYDYGYAGNRERTSFHDCRAFNDEMSDCRCDSGSSTMCNYGALSNCLEEKTEVEPLNTTCSQPKIDHSLLKEFYSRFVNLLVEPLRNQVRALRYKLSSFKHSVSATDLLINSTYALCAEHNETPCFPEASNILSKKLTKLAELKRNITMDMIRLQEKVESVLSGVAALKEQTLLQIQTVINDYTCCLIGLKFSVKDDGCKPPAPPASLRPSTPPATKSCPFLSFYCDNKNCVPFTARCNGVDDCGDRSDEAHC